MAFTNLAYALIIAITAGLPYSNSEDLKSNHCSGHEVVHTVQAGENLHSISAQFGSFLFWEAIYIANADKVSHPDRIYPGQKIRVPYYVANYPENETTLSNVLENPFCKVSDLPYTYVQGQFISLYSVELLESKASAELNQDETDHSANDKKEEAIKGSVDIDTFREAFDAVTQSKNTGQKETMSEKAQRESEKQLMLEIDGMVHDETRSKVGRDFYDVFYSYWQSPPQANNYTIRVAEQPSPNLGTTIYVTVNQTETFRMRLQPRYEMIQEAGKYAVRQTYSHLQNNAQRNMIY